MENKSALRREARGFRGRWRSVIEMFLQEKDVLFTVNLQKCTGPNPQGSRLLYTLGLVEVMYDWNDLRYFLELSR